MCVLGKACATQHKAILSFTQFFLNMVEAGSFCLSRSWERGSIEVCLYLQ